MRNQRDGRLAAAASAAAAVTSAARAAFATRTAAVIAARSIARATRTARLRVRLRRRLRRGKRQRNRRYENQRRNDQLGQHELVHSHTLDNAVERGRNILRAQSERAVHRAGYKPARQRRGVIGINSARRKESPGARWSLSAKTRAQPREAAGWTRFEVQPESWRPALVSRQAASGATADHPAVPGLTPRRCNSSRRLNRRAASSGTFGSLGRSSSLPDRLRRRNTSSLRMRSGRAAHNFRWSKKPLGTATERSSATRRSAAAAQCDSQGRPARR